MRITQQGDIIRFQLIEKNLDGSGWIERFDFRIFKGNYKELSEHMIKSLQEFKPK